MSKAISRSQLLTISNYLTTKGRLVLGVKGPRVDDVRKDYLVLLLPGKKVPAVKVKRLIEPTSIELYHLSRVATKKSPDRPWKIRVPSSVKGPYLFLGPNAQRIDSHKDPKALLTEVVGYPDAKPVLTGHDILPTAFARQATNGWAVQIRFNRSGAHTFFDFTKRNRGEYLAVFYNGRLISAPIIRESIPRGDAMITGFATSGQAQSAVTDLNAGILPAQLKITRVESY